MYILLNIFLRVVTIISFVVRTVIWRITDTQAAQQKERTMPASFKAFLMKLILKALGLLIVIQLFGLSLVPITKNALIFQVFGFLLVIPGTIISIAGRVSLGNSWTHGEDYQIKKDHELVT